MAGISGRLLVLTVVVVMLVEVVIFVPSVARFRMDYLQERIVRAEIAALTVTAAPDGFVAPDLEARLLRNSGTLNVAVRDAGVRILALPGQPIETMVQSFDLRNASALTLIRDAVDCLFGDKEGMVFRVVGDTGRGVFDQVEITLMAQPLRAAMLDYGMRILQLSLIISIITAVCVFIVVRRFVVAPLLGVIGSMKAFQANPEDPARVITPASRLGEVAEAERALAAMQRDVHMALRARARLASLGEAVAKVNHDLRNMLASVQLMADRLEMSSDPLVGRVLPKLIGSLDRAIALCQTTLDFGRAEERAPDPRSVPLPALIAEVAEAVGIAGTGGTVALRHDLAPEARVTADPDHLYRVLLNLMRNSTEAIRAAGRPGEIALSLVSGDDGAVITLRDTGPGMPAKARENLFRPFHGGARQGGTGLGLAIAAELVRANGGRLDLVETGPGGTRFDIHLPDRTPSA
ncbi:MAG: HAMP domain-containing sensor histidine kinase [Thermohalobaculum sp.]|nr:HAMP domain-containing sensor histidine kinase [Thermohalobaculum sp.]